MQTSRLENGKQRKLDQPIEPPPPNNTGFSDTSDSNNDCKLGWYCHDSLDSSDNGCSDFSEQEEGDEEGESNEDKSIALPSLLALRPAELSWNKAGKAKLHRAWGKGSSATKERKKRNVREYQRQALQSYNLSDIFAKSWEKIAKLEQTRLEEDLEIQNHL